MKRAKYIILIFLSLPIWEIAAYEPPDLNIHLEIRQMEEAKQPYFIGNNCVITYKASHPIRYVGVAFEHEHFSEIHPLIRNDHNTFILLFPIDPNSGIGQLKYRIVVDGLWMSDPNNPMSSTDANGIKLSKVTVPPRLSAITDSPIIQPNGTVKFLYEGPADRNVYLVADFNNWDPFMHRMKEQTPGLYELNLRVLPGDHFYYYLSNGLKMLDPLNSNKGLDYEGEEASHFAFIPTGTGR